MQGYNPSLPKALLPVAGRPFADWQLSWLASEGIESVVYSIGYKGDLIREFVGDGANWGLRVTYVEETGGLLGTGGAIRLAADQDALDERFFVLYGDSYLRVDLRSVDRVFEERGLPAIMTVFANDGRWDTSNVVFDGTLVVEYRKGADRRIPEMRYIDYGLSELSRLVVVDEIPSDRPSDLAALLEALSRRAQLGGYEVFQRFFEIGSPSGIQELHEHLSGMEA
jgi:NDP-sugar pyrophosphorylase family protein